jgi:mannose-1-phosphate guanylyltransferase
MFENLYHVIMAGGSGTRFWPASRRDRPKQFLNLVGSESMIRQTADRCAGSGPVERIYISAGEDHRAGVKAALGEFPDARFIGEPVGRNTAPAVGLSAMTLFLADPDAVAVFCPADHIYADLAGYRSAIDKAVEAAASGDYLVTLGIDPTRPETGYGHIEAGDVSEVDGVRHVKAFIEKPDEPRAKEFAASGCHYWNSGVFIWRVSSILAAIGRHHRVLAEGLTLFRNAARAAAGHDGPVTNPFSYPEVVQVVADVFKDQPSISIDYAVMENAPNALVVPCNAGWSDVGSWDAIAEIQPSGADGNQISGEVIAVHSKNNFVRAGNRTVALVGVEDLIVVEAEDSILICRKGSSQKVREVVAALSDKDRGDLV